MTKFTDDDYQIIDKKTVFQGYFAVDKLTLKHRLYNGNWSRSFQREIFERGSAAAVLLYDPLLGRVVLQEQFRIGALSSTKSPWMLEVVAGIIEQGETAESVAIREAKEEAGQVISDLVEICSYFSTPGGSSEKVTLYCAQVDANNADGVFGLEEENEDINVFSLSIEEVKQGLEDNIFENATCIVALQWLLLNQKKLNEKWRKL